MKEYVKKISDFINEAKLNESKINVDINQYKRSTGKNPRGMGTWAFFKDSDCTIEGQENIDYKFFSGTFDTARNSAIEWAEELNYDTIYVGS